MAEGALFHGLTVGALMLVGAIIYVKYLSKLIFG
jgi:hypothetical protein